MEGLTIGSAVEVSRINGEARRGYIVDGPLDYMRHIGDFYQIGSRPPEATEARRRKQPIFGTYLGADIRPLIF